MSAADPVLSGAAWRKFCADLADVLSITVDWEVGAAAVYTRQGIADLEARTAHRVVTTGCGQGTVFGDLMAEIDDIRLPGSATLSRTALYALLECVRQHLSLIHI